MTHIHAWASRHNITPTALHDLLSIMGLGFRPAPPTNDATGEAAVQAAVRLEAARRGMILWRNNSGALKDEGGRMVRFGLGNDSQQSNHVFKSSDLIGIETVRVTPEMVGTDVGLFSARECKRPGWVYTGTDRERAQAAFIQFITARGGTARFVTTPEEL